MKRALIASLVVLELALVALVWWASTRTSTREGSPLAQPQITGSEAANEAALELEAPAHEPPTREDAHPVSIRPSPNIIGLRRRLPPRGPQEDPFADAELHGLVVFADTGLPVSGGQVVCYAAVPLTSDVPAGIHAELSRARREGADSPSDWSLLALIGADGTFCVPVSKSARIERLDVLAQSPSDSSGRTGHLPLVLELDKTLADLGPVLRLEVERGFDLSGLVVDAASGAPIAGAHVQAGRNWTSSGTTAESDASGNFVLTNMGLCDARSSASLICSHAESLRTEFEFGPEALHPRASRIVLRPRRGNTLSGTLVDREGKPLWGVNIRMDLQDPDVHTSERLEGEPLRARSGMHGEFELKPLPGFRCATITIDDQCTHGRAILAQRIPLGTMQSTRRDVVFHVSTGVTVAVTARMPDGSRLAPDDFTLVCTADGSSRVLSRTSGAQSLNVPLSERIEIDAFARAPSPDGSTTLAHGTGIVRYDHDLEGPQSLTIVLEERRRLVLPQRPEGAVELELPALDYLRGAIDVQLLDDDTGNALEQGRLLGLRCGQSSEGAASPLNGWLRLVGQPGRYELRVCIGQGAEQTLQLTIPASGYGTCTAHVRTGP